MTPNHDPDLDMLALLTDQPPNTVGLGSRTGDAVTRRTENLKKWKGLKTMAENQKCDPDWTLEDMKALLISLRTIRQERDKLAAFKSFVHNRLDLAGVPTHPDGPHSKEGCRIGDRLDLVCGAWQMLLEWVSVYSPEEAARLVPQLYERARKLILVKSATQAA